MYTFILTYAIIMAVVGFYSLILSSSNIRFLKENRKTGMKPERGLKVSVLIPARNEEENLQNLLDSLVCQDYPDYEILVIDDNSTDRTWQIIEDYMLRYPSLVRGVKGKPKEDKAANGKIYALEQLEAIAEGELLLATDADTIHKSNSISYAVTLLEKYDLDMLSGFPEERCGTLWATAITAAMNFATVLYIPLSLACRHPNELFTLANGQFVMMKKAVLDSIGGYKAIERKLIDDVNLAKFFIRNKKRYALVSVSNVIACNMYKTTKEAFLGITRSIGGHFPVPFWVLLSFIFTVLFILLLALAPAVIIALCFFLPGYLTPLLLLLLGTAAFAISWYRTARLQGYSPLCSIIYPYTLVMICLMYIYSYYMRSHGRYFHWKGREV